MNQKVKKINIALKEFSPVVLKSYFFTNGMDFPQGYRFNKRYVYDYEIEYFTDSNGSMLIDDKLYPIHKGDVAFRRPGQTTQGIMQYNCYLICFDLIGNSNKNHDLYDFAKEQEFQNYYINPVLEAIPPVFHPPIGEKYHYLFEGLLKEFINPGEASPLMLKSYILQLLAQLHVDVHNPLTSDAVPLSPHYSTIKRVVEYIRKNLSNKISLNILAQVADLSPNHFHKIFSETLDITPNEFITKLRLEKAKELLVKTNLPIAEIAVQCGFENTPYFSSVFKKQLNTPPGEFRKSHSYLG
ncbi:MAG: AraC family transcriptional regulator [Clostridia bacterium]|nr:AraC family transcriptional regulator [Clostridia bacterium]